MCNFFEKNINLNYSYARAHIKQYVDLSPFGISTALAIYQFDNFHAQFGTNPCRRSDSC
jgi:hypothetical protein